MMAIASKRSSDTEVIIVILPIIIMIMIIKTLDWS